MKHSLCLGFYPASSCPSVCAWFPGYPLPVFLTPSSPFLSSCSAITLSFFPAILVLAVAYESTQVSHVFGRSFIFFPLQLQLCNSSLMAKNHTSIIYTSCPHCLPFHLFQLQPPHPLSTTLVLVKVTPKLLTILPNSLPRLHLRSVLPLHTHTHSIFIFHSFLEYNLFIIKITYFKCMIQCLYLFTELCNCSHICIQNISIIPQRSCCPLKVTPTFPPPPSPWQPLIYFLSL